MLPALTFINALPCTIDIEVVQPPSAASSQEHSTDMDGAFELFFLPDEYAAKNTILDESVLEKEWRPFSSQRKIRQMSKFLYSGSIRGGDKIDLASFHTDRALYFRVRIQESESWSKPFFIPRVLLQNRKKYIKHTAEPAKWDYRSSNGKFKKECIDFSMKRSWKSESNRAVEFFSSFWVINKSGLCLRYRTEAHEDVTSSSSLAPNGCNNDISDSFHLSCVGSQSLPLVLNSSLRRIRFLPYDLVTNISRDQFYIFDVKSLHKSIKFRVSRGLRRDRPVFIDEASYLAVSWPECILSLQSNSTQNCIIRTALRDASSKELEILSFRLSHDAYVDICIDSRYSNPPPWASRLGFRKQQGQKVLTNYTPLTFNIYRKFYKSVEVVKLGGNSAECDFRTDCTSYFVIVSKFKGSHGEPSIFRLQVNNQSSLFSRSRQYQLLPMFSVGDKLYVDCDILCFSLPSTLKAMPILAIQTCNEDAELHNEGILEFELQQPSYVLICVDSRLSKTLPFWIRKLGFRKIDNFNILGGQDGSIKYETFSKCFSEYDDFKIVLHGLGKSKEDNNYFVLIVNESDFASSCSGTYDRTVSSPLHFITDEMNGIESIVNASCNLNHFWNEESLGKLVYQPFTLDPFGLNWSEPCSLEHGDREVVHTTDCLFSVSVSRLPGIFSRTNAVMLLPRFICCSKLSIPIIIRPQAEGFYSETSEINPSPMSVCEGTKLHLNAFESGVIYNFGSGVSKIPIHLKRTIIICDGLEGNDIPSTFSKAINCDDLSLGDQYIWISCGSSSVSFSSQGRILVMARLIMEGSTTVIYLTDASANPPYRIENRTSSFALKFRQAGVDEQWICLSPHTWKSYAVYCSSHAREIEVSVKDAYGTSSKVFGLDDIYSHSYFSWKHSPSQYENLICGSSSVDGLTKVITFFEISAKIPILRQLKNYRQTSMSQQRSLEASDNFVHKLKSSIKFSVALSGLELALLSSDRSYFLSAYVDSINLQYLGPQSSILFSIFHINIDDMRKRAKFSVVLSPRDSGLNSHLQEIICEKAWLSVKCKWNPVSTKVIHMHSLDIEVCPLDIKIDGELIFCLLDILGDSLVSSDEDKIILSSARIPTVKLQEVFTNAARDILLFEFKNSIFRTQFDSSRAPVFIENFHHSQIIIYFEFYLGQPDPSNSASASSSSVLKFMPRVLGSIVHSSATISFKEKKIENYFGDIDNLTAPIVASFQQEATVQCYKIFGSLDVIGDPLSLFGDIGAGFEKFVQKTEDEIVSLDLRGEGVKSLVFSVVGGVFNSISKITSSVADIVNATTGASRSYEVSPDSEANSSTGSQAASILFRSVVTGFSGLIDEPGRGFTREGSLGAVKGIFKGLFSLIATPVAGTLDAVSVVSDGVSSSLQSHGKPIGRRRNPT